MFWFSFFVKIGQVSEVLKAQGTQLLLPVALLHGAAFALGYWLSKTSFGESTSRTISIECGMQVLVFYVLAPHGLWPIKIIHATSTDGWIWFVIFSYDGHAFHFVFQSSALGFLLAQKHFTNPLVAVPSAVSVVCMAVRNRLAYSLLLSSWASKSYLLGLLFQTPDIVSHLSAARWKCACCLLEEQTSSDRWQGWLQRIGRLQHPIFQTGFIISVEVAVLP